MLKVEKIALSMTCVLLGKPKNSLIIPLAVGLTLEKITLSMTYVLLGKPKNSLIIPLAVGLTLLFLFVVLVIFLICRRTQR